jgi:hypothetical protein
MPVEYISNETLDSFTAILENVSAEETPNIDTDKLDECILNLQLETEDYMAINFFPIFFKSEEYLELKKVQSFGIGV